MPAETLQGSQAGTSTFKKKPTSQEQFNTDWLPAGDQEPDSFTEWVPAGHSMHDVGPRGGTRLSHVAAHATDAGTPIIELSLDEPSHT